MEDQKQISRPEIAKLKFALLRTWQILRDILRGYFAGQPSDDSRPRKGCC
jgi:hypothetical protein